MTGIIPGTMNVGNTFPTVVEALIFMSAVPVDPLTLVSMSLAAPAGSVLGAGAVARMPRRRIQLGMGFGLAVVAVTMLGGLLRWWPMGGEAIGLAGWKLALARPSELRFSAPCRRSASASTRRAWPSSMPWGCIPGPPSRS